MSKSEMKRIGLQQGMSWELVSSLIRKSESDREVKLIICPMCTDVVSLTRELRFCSCRKSWGKYNDVLNATYGGVAFPLCLNNGDLKQALSSTLEFAPFIRAWIAPKDSKTFVKE